MKFHLFEARTEVHIRKSLDYLQEARLAWVEHQAAAEHHAALAKMYAERISRIEEEIKMPHPPQPMPSRQPPDEMRDELERPRPESVVVYPSRTLR